MDLFLFSIVDLAVVFADKGHLLKFATTICVMGWHGELYFLILIGASHALNDELDVRCLLLHSLLLV